MCPISPGSARREFAIIEVLARMEIISVTACTYIQSAFWLRRFQRHRSAESLKPSLSRLACEARRSLYMVTYSLYLRALARFPSNIDELQNQLILISQDSL